MSKHGVTGAKQERIIEAVRRGLEGDAAVEFIRNSGYALSSAGIARHLRSLGGRGEIQKRIDQGQSNTDILNALNPEAVTDSLQDEHRPSQQELFVDISSGDDATSPEDLNHPIYETAKVTLRLPTDVYEALRAAAKAEQKTQNEIAVEILTNALAQMPEGFLIEPRE